MSDVDLEAYRTRHPSWFVQGASHAGERAPWILVGPLASQYVHYPNDKEWPYVSTGKKTAGQHLTYRGDATVHIGAKPGGGLVCDVGAKEYCLDHPFFGNIAVEEVPEELLRKALRASVLGTNIIFRGRQRLIIALANTISELDGMEIALPEPLYGMSEQSNDTAKVRRLRRDARPILAHLQKQLAPIVGEFTT